MTRVEPMSDELSLTDEEQRWLLAAARDAIESAVLERHEQIAPQEARGVLARPSACFVTLHESGQLRGCIGTLEARQPLSSAVRTMAIGAAVRDPRFPPVETVELPALELSVSVLSPPRAIERPAQVDVGRHGLVVSRGGRRGVLLPQVATEQGWDRDTFLCHTCLKAGLPSQAWRDPDTLIEVFSAQVFGEPGNAHC